MVRLTDEQMIEAYKKLKIILINVRRGAYITPAIYSIFKVFGIKTEFTDEDKDDDKPNPT